MENGYIKIYLDQEEFFCNEDMSYEETGRLTAAMFAYMRTGEDPADEFFERGTQARMAWRVLKRHLDACMERSAVNSANRSTKEKDSEETKTKTKESKGTKRNKKETEETKTNGNEPEETETSPKDACIHTHTQEHTQTHTQEQKQDHAHAHDSSASESAASVAAADNADPEWTEAYYAAMKYRITDGKEDIPEFIAACLAEAKSCTPEWVREAIRQCQRQHCCSWAYFAAILRGYEEAGGIDTDDPVSKARNRPYTGKPRKTDYDQRPNQEPDGDCVPEWLLERRKAETERSDAS